MSSKTSVNIFLILMLMVSCSKGSSLKRSTPNESSVSTSDDSGEIYQSPGDGSVGTSGIDPLGASAWHLRNIGQNSFSTPECLSGSCPYGTAVIGEDSGLGNSHSRFTKGSGVRVAVSDNGTDIYHEDLYYNIDAGMTRNYTSDDPNDWLGDPTPSGGSSEIAAHGTAVTGIIGAIKNNSRGSYGIAPEATLVPFKYVGTTGSWAKEIDQAGGLFDVFNYSYGRSSCTYSYMNSSYLDQLKYGVENLRSGKGALYVKAAGNEYVSYLSDCDGSDSDYYLGNANFEEDNSYPYLVVTAAMNAAGKSSSYSTPGSSVWISAPAGEFGDDSPAIITTDLMDCEHGFSKGNATENTFESGTNPLNSNCNYTSTMNGTSSAAPMVSGAIALILAQRPELSWRDVKDILARSARQIDSSNNGSSYPLSDSRFPTLSGHKYQEGWTTNAAGFKFHNWFGFGALDIEAALELASSRTTTMPAYVETLSNGAWKYLKTLSLAIPDYSASGASNSISVSENLIAEEVQVRLTVDHTRASDLGIELTSPSGTKSQLMLINSNVVDKKLNDVVLLSNAFYGENAQGSWTLKVIDGRSGETGTLKKWGVHIFGHSASASPGVLSTQSLASGSDAIRSDTRDVSVNSGASAVRAIATIKSAEQLGESKTTKIEQKDIKTPNRVMSSFTTGAIKKGQEKEEDSKVLNTNLVCLTTIEEAELTLNFSGKSQKILGSKDQLGIFAYDELGGRIVIALRSEDGESLAKTMVFDRELKLIDESFLEGASAPYSLSAGSFVGEQVSYLTPGGLSMFNLSDLSTTKKFDQVGLHSLVLTPHESSAQSANGLEEFIFDASGVIYSRQKVSAERPLSHRPLVWSDKGELCVSPKGGESK